MIARWLLMAALMLITLPAHASEADLQKQINALKQRLDALERPGSQLPNLEYMPSLPQDMMPSAMPFCTVNRTGSLKCDPPITLTPDK